jgi:hypothetical protein
MSVAARAVAGLHGVDVDAVNRVCDAMTAVADEDGNITGAQLLRIVVDEGIVGLAAMDLRRQLGIVAAVPPRTSRVRCACVRCSASARCEATR